MGGGKNVKLTAKRRGGPRNLYTSKDELDLMYENLTARGLGNFQTKEWYWYWYWSSSEYNSDYARVQRFSDGDQHSYSKNNASSVRAVRAF
jgi:hypothetical protein